ncbi:hypothetical protein [Marinobacterium rhizophilum]|uniref:Uncharacterized protein n=1 Tax=Marinobacterium rhizophilum TaxID=420402 RepID=A0ABY5HKP9_9GAMM|nr:hypothetical protein [Marinobacterium rhizophilum]UTW12972.1 hypothetical protein KDW95_04665 [Marinobacterium rhizophilum]
MRRFLMGLALSGLLSISPLNADDPVFPPGAAIHPLCFDQLLAGLTGDSPFSPVTCDAMPGKYPVVIFPGQDAADLTYTAQRRTDEGYARGFIAYAVAGHWPSKTGDDKWTLFEVTAANGYGNLRSSIWLLLQPQGNRVVKPLLYVPGGDRCNDGALRVSEVGAERLIYLSAATPFRLLNPTRLNEWRLFMLQHAGESQPGRVGGSRSQPPFMDWKPYLDVANGAGACAGGIIKSYNFKTDTLDVLGVRIDPSAFLSAQQGAKQACINDWLRAQDRFRNKGVQDLDLDEWDRMLGTLEPACAQH